MGIKKTSKKWEQGDNPCKTEYIKDFALHQRRMSLIWLQILNSESVKDIEEIFKRTPSWLSVHSWS